MSTDTDDAPRIAIACQGGGSHTAFTAGVLGRLLREREDRAFEPVAFSGTSGAPSVRPPPGTDCSTGTPSGPSRPSRGSGGISRRARRSTG
ncbi:hypothetical protein [Halalkalicoccus salilacus]|uniref:hypothetical protein n=1 Tax=Halalkalicoccus sp. GCM10025704 TaxID=3252662 RepID=UPI00361583CD